MTAIDALRKAIEVLEESQPDGDASPGDWQDYEDLLTGLRHRLAELEAALVSAGKE